LCRGATNLDTADANARLTGAGKCQGVEVVANSLRRLWVTPATKIGLRERARRKGLLPIGAGAFFAVLWRHEGGPPTSPPSVCSGIRWCCTPPVNSLPVVDGDRSRASAKNEPQAESPPAARLAEVVQVASGPTRQDVEEEDDIDGSVAEAATLRTSGAAMSKFT
jgi:hypothetical protein